MPHQLKMSENTIRGSCPLFVCRICRTKFGWKHQFWCDICELTEPSCQDCRYYSTHRHECLHPAKRERRDRPYAQDQGPL